MIEAYPPQEHQDVRMAAEARAIEPNSQSELEQALVDYGIPYQRWGGGPTKTIDHLFAEICQEECRLVAKGEQLARFVMVATVDIRTRRKTPDGDRWLQLLEDRQVFRNGAKRERMSPLSEKVKRSEDPEIAAMRGIHEELQVEYGGILRARPSTMQIGESRSYPGLRSMYRVYPFAAIFTPGEYREEYVERQPDKDTYFHWYPVEEW